MTRFLYCTLNLKNITHVNKAVLPATIGDKMSWDTLPETQGFFNVLLTSKGVNIAFPPPSPPCNYVVPKFKLPTENNKHPNFERRGQGNGADSFVLWFYPIWVQCLNNFVTDCRLLAMSYDFAKRQSTWSWIILNLHVALQCTLLLLH